MIIHVSRHPILTLLFLIASLQAQTYMGVGASFASQMEYGGLNIRGQFDLFKTKTGKMAACPNVSQYAPTNDMSRFEFNMDFHNMLGESKDFMGYLIAGLRYDLDLNGISTSQITTAGDLGLNLGMGMQYNMIEQVKFFIEGKYLGVSEFTRFQIGTGFAVVLGKIK